MEHGNNLQPAHYVVRNSCTLFFIFFILTQKVLVRLLLYLTCKLLLNRGYMWTKMGPVWLLNPPPPPGPHIATDITMFSHICKTYYPLFFLVVHMYPVSWGLHETLVPLDSTYASPGPPKMKTKIWKNVHHITSIFYILLSFGVILRCLWGLEAYIYIYIYNFYEFCWPMYTDLGRPGDTFAVAGDRAI